MRAKHVHHEFVEFIPDEIAPETLYVSIPYATAVHLCLCGCGERVVTPLSPTDWRLIFDGDSVSLHPSIGNWSFDCQSHYWIERNQVVWGDRWSREMIATGRARERRAKDQYYGEPIAVGDGTGSSTAAEHRLRPGWWRRWLARLRG